MDRPDWLPRFEYDEDHWVVHYEGRQWWLMSSPRLHERQGFDPRGWDVNLSFDMRLIPPAPDLSIPDNIVLGDN